MRKISTMLFALLLLVGVMNLGAQVNQDWKWSHPGPQGNTMRWAKMIDANNWYAVGYAGTFMKTSNAGVNWTFYTNAGGWQPSFYGQGRILYSGWFFSLNNGLVCGSSGWIARTTNGGLNWDSIASPTTNALYGLHFVSATVGFAGGASGTVLKTTDAGITWTALTTGVTTTIYNIYAVDTSKIYAPTTVGNLLVTTNGGVNWTTSYTGASYTVYDANFVNANTGMTVGTSYNARITTNGGTNWTSVPTGSTGTLYELFSTTTVTGPSVPYTQGFDTTLFPPPGWRTVSITGTPWVRSTSYYNSAPASAYITYVSAGNDQWLMTPKWGIMSGDSLVFWWKNAFSSAYPPDSLIIKASATDSNVTSFTSTILALNTSAAPYTWTRYAVSLNAYAGQNIYIGFHHIDTDGNGGYMDDVSIQRQGQVVPTFYVAGDSYGIYKTSNLGVNWTLLPFNDPAMPWTSTHYTVDVSGSTIFAAGAFGLMQKSTNAGANFTCLTNFISPGAKYGVWAQYSNGLVIVAGAPGSAGATFDQVLRSTNGGTNWAIVPFGSTSTYYDIAMLNSNTGFICGSNGALRKTTNGGLNWDSVPGPFGANILRRIEFVNASTGYLFQSSGATNGAWKTTNGGANWDSIPGIGAETRGYASSFVNANTGYVGNYTPKLMKTTNGGVNWTVLTNTPLGSGFIYGVNFFSPDSGYACGTAAGRLCRTTNGGTTFDTVPQPFAVGLYTMKWFRFNSGWIFGTNGFAGRTTNAGASWLIYNTAGATPYGCWMNSDSGFVVGSSGYIHKITKAPLTTTEWKPEIPSTYYLKQNYPNPFNPTTTIEFAIPKTGLVSLKIYDIAGREISSLFNTMLNPGVVKYTFNGATYASGVYFYRLAVDGKTIDTKKMVLVK